MPDNVKHVGFPGGSVVKNLLQCGRPGFDPWVGKIPWRRHGNPLQYSCLLLVPWTEEPGGL